VPQLQPLGRREHREASRRGEGQQQAVLLTMFAIGSRRGRPICESTGLLVKATVPRRQTSPIIPRREGNIADGNILLQ
jgi:hypothetical protein